MFYYFIRSAVHWTSIISSLSEALNPIHRSSGAAADRADFIVCLSIFVFVSVSMPFIPGLLMIMFLLSGLISTMHALENKHLNPCFQSSFHHLSSIHLIYLSFINPSHSSMHRSIHCHLFINPLPFKKIHSYLRKDKPQKRAIFSSLKLQSLIQISVRGSFFYNNVLCYNGII